MKDRYPIGIVRIMLDGSLVDINVHPAKREVRFEKETEVADVVKRAVAVALKEPDLTFKYDLTKFAESFTPSEELPPLASVEGAQATLGTVVKEEGPRGGAIIVPIAQVMNTYILAETAGSLLLIDQHAASERIVYEQILRAIETGHEISQTLLTPLVVRLTVAEARVLEENRESLEKSGFKIDPFGKDAHALRSIPTVLGVAQGESALRNILADLARMAPAKRVGLDAIWRVACHTAVRAGERLTSGQMRALVDALVRTDSPYTCEHGRPTMVVLSTSDLEKLFKRRV
jgi:DNA mismatch repair protein MutL